MSTVGFYTDAGEQTNVSASVAAAEAAATASATSASGAATSEVNALSYSNNASTSANNAGTSETNASVSETSAAMSADDSANSAIASAASAVDANVSEGNALTSENNAAASAAAALVSENSAAATLAGALTETNNLSDVSDVTTSRTNLDVYSKEEADTGRKNYLINGSFDIWQRGISFITPNSEYTSDRWISDIFNSTGVGVVERLVFAVEVPLGGPTLKHYLRTSVSVAVGSSTNIIQQKIKGVHSLAGKEVTFSFWGRCQNANTYTCRLGQTFGTGGAPSATVFTDLGTVNFTGGTTWEKFSFTATLPPLVGKTLGTAGDDYLQLAILDAGGQVADWIDFTQMQLEEGSVATPFEYRPIGEELALCQRYYIKADDVSRFTYVDTASDLDFVTHSYPVTMRAVPSIAFSDISNVQGDGTLAASVIRTSNFSSTQSTGRTSTGQSRATFNFTADAEL